MKKEKVSPEEAPKQRKPGPSREKSTGTDEGGEGGTSGNWGGGATQGTGKTGPRQP